MKGDTLRKKLGELRDSISDRFGIAKATKTAPGKKSKRGVHFGPVVVTEFERLLCGGGGVPDGDVVSLGLGSPVRTYQTEVRERGANNDKDSYCYKGFLDVRKRVHLLRQWMPKKEYLQLLRNTVKPELSKLRRNREESNSVGVNMREMPASLAEALAQAKADAAAAARACAPALHKRRASITASFAGSHQLGAASRVPALRSTSSTRSQPSAPNSSGSDGPGEDASQDEDESRAPGDGAPGAPSDSEGEGQVPVGRRLVGEKVGEGALKRGLGAAEAPEGAKRRRHHSEVSLHQSLHAALGADEADNLNLDAGVAVEDGQADGMHARWLVWRDF